jgi:hypothetical protein
MIPWHWALPLTTPISHQDPSSHNLRHVELSRREAAQGLLWILPFPFGGSRKSKADIGILGSCRHWASKR